MSIHTYRQKLRVKERIRKRDNYTCQLCVAPGWQVDHIIPFAISHDSSEANLRILCKACNYKTRRERKDAAMSNDKWWEYIQKEYLDSLST